jgi:hypothetical protein
MKRLLRALWRITLPLRQRADSFVSSCVIRAIESHTPGCVARAIESHTPGCVARALETHNPTKALADDISLVLDTLTKALADDVSLVLDTLLAEHFRLQEQVEVLSRQVDLLTARGDLVSVGERGARKE